MKMHLTKSKLLLLSLPFYLAACGGSDVKETLGIGPKAPDEFRVVARPPLSVPPEFDLRPPSDGEEMLSGTPASDKAKTLVIGPDGSTTVTLPVAGDPVMGSADTAIAPVTASAPASNADEQFLQNVGSKAANPSIRETLHQDNQVVVKKQEENESGWFSSIWSPPKPKEPIVDAKGESDRIKENKAEGKAVTEGDTPVKKGKDRGILDSLFNNQ